MHKNIGVFFGGKSPEHDVSIITAQLIISELKKMGYVVTPVYLSKGGEWHIDEKLGRLKFFHEDDREVMLKNFRKYYLDLENSNGKIIFKKKGLGSKKIEIDLAFPAFHGMNGEDGTVQGLFEILNIPYVGCDVASSAITIDKILTKLYYQSQNIATTKFVYFTKKDWNGNRDETLKKIKTLRWPLFVKPPKLGSSIGITKAKNEEGLIFGIEVALHYGERVLVEEGVESLMDVTCSVMGNDELTASLLQESVFQSDLLDFEEKYLKEGGTQFGESKRGVVIPARLDERITRAIREKAKEIYKLFGCSGIARVDFLFDESMNIFYANEVNTLPGTLYHHLWKASGVELDELIAKLIGYAEEKYKMKNEIQYTFESGMLKYSKSIKLSLKEEKDGQSN